MAISNWLCSNNTKTMVVKIVHPGGHVELHDRPIIAADIIGRNPKCCVAFPNVFKQPWAIVAPDTTLLPGQKFYVVPISTIRKLQLLSKLHQEIETDQHTKSDGDCQSKASTFGLIKKNYFCSIQFNKGGTGKEGAQSQELGCPCACFLSGMMMKSRNENKSNETMSSNSFGSSSETKALTKKGNKESAGSPKRLSSFDQWRPNLESITEE